MEDSAVIFQEELFFPLKMMNENLRKNKDTALKQLKTTAIIHSQYGLIQ